MESARLKKNIVVSDFWFEILGIGTSFVVFHTYAWSWVHRYYQSHLPHYDSIGSYTEMFKIVNAVKSDGYFPAAIQVKDFFLSWLQGAFAFFGAPVLETTPESMQLYNSICVLAFMVSIYVLARSFGAERTKSLALSWIVILPDVFFEPQGGLIDLQRDPSFLCLLAASFLFFIAGVRSEKAKHILWSGIFLGLCVLSRGNAFLMVVATMGPIVFFYCVSIFKRGQGWHVLKRAIPGLIAFLALSLPNVIQTLEQNVLRYKNKYVFYAFETAPLDSLALYWDVPLRLFFGNPDSFGLTSFRITVFTFLAIGAVIFYFVISKKLLFEVGTFKKFRNFLGSGLWFLIATYIIICGMVGWSGFTYHAAKHPFYPSLIFFFTVICSLSLSFTWTKAASKTDRRIFLGSILTIILTLLIVRGEARVDDLSEPQEHVAIANQLSKLFSTTDRNSIVAFFWHETLSFDTVKYFSARNGLWVPEKFNFVSPEGHKLDFAVTALTRESIPQLLEIVRTSVKADADYLVVSKRPAAYSIPNDRFFIFSDGAEMVASFFKEKAYNEIFSYTLWRGTPQEETFSVLKNSKTN